MPPPSTSSVLHLQILPKPFRVFKLLPSTSFPLALLGILQKPPIGDEFVSVTRNAGEVSVVTDHVFDPSDELGVNEEGNSWRCIKVKGPMEHSLTGIMAALTAPLRDAEVPIFAISTWNTDWLLVGISDLEKAAETLRADGALLILEIKELTSLINPYSEDLLFYHDTGLAGEVRAAPKTRGPLRQMERARFSALNLTRSSDSSAPSTPKSSHIANLPPESPTSPIFPRSSSPAGRTSQPPSSSRPPSQLRARDSRPPYLPFRRISLPPAPNQKRDSIASIFTVDSVKEHDEHDAPPQPVGQVSASLPTESSMPDLGLPPPPPIPASRTPLSSSPSRRVVILAPPSTSGTSATPSRVRPRHMSSQSQMRALNQSPGRLVPAASKSSRKSIPSRPIIEEKAREREEKRRRVAKELLDTEQTYVDGLDLVYNASLQLAGSTIGLPVDDSSSTHAREPSTTSESTEPALLPNLVSVLAQHVPYLRLYKPFVTGFPASMERLAKLSTNESFRIWLKEKERDPACGMLGLRSWLLSIVQRCPRYLLLAKDLEKSSNETDEGYSELSSVLALLTKITNALNTSLADHTAVLALLDLQRNTSSLPPGFSFVAPGRSLIRRGRLRISGQEVSQGGVMRRVTGAEGEREVLLFSDCVVWLERELDWGLREPPPKRPPPKPLTTMEGSISSEERWRFRGMANLMDVEVVVSPRNAMQIDFLSPEGSFALYASTYDEREEWINAIRSSKATLLATFNVTHPDSTLTSSSSTTHLRRVLQALPYPPGEATLRGTRDPIPPRRSIIGGGSRLRQREPVVSEGNEDADTENSQPGRTAFPKQSNSEKQKERRGRVEHYVPPIWVPDREAPNFFVMDPSNPDASKSRKPERACILCYEAVFPVLDSSAGSIDSSAERGDTMMPLRQSPARPRILEHLVSTSPITTPAIERPHNAGLTASPSSPTMLTPSAK
ncbi:hypothetical protein FRC11_007493 [Ceratobasidium sp. 423]|nr:hypothetical protein FRC11_007493 [Ceratobasidium sp. 423]